MTFDLFTSESGRGVLKVFIGNTAKLDDNIRFILEHKLMKIQNKVLKYIYKIINKGSKNYKRLLFV